MMMITRARTPIFILLLAIDLLMFIDFPAYMRSNNYPLSNIPYHIQCAISNMLPNSQYVHSFVSSLLLRWRQYFKIQVSKYGPQQGLGLFYVSLCHFQVFINNFFSSARICSVESGEWRVEREQWWKSRVYVSVSEGLSTKINQSIKINQEQPRAIK